MLHKTIQLAIPFAQDLTHSRIALGLGDGSHLAPMVSSSVLSNPDAGLSTTAFIENVKNVTFMQGGVTENEQVSEAHVNDLQSFLQVHLSMARQIGAESKAFSEVIQGYLASAPSDDPTGNFNIVKDDMGDLFDESSVLGDLEGAMPPRGFVGATIVSGPRDFDGIMAYLATGRPNIDQALVSTVSQYNRSFLENIWYGLFNPAMGIETPYHIGNLATLPSGERLSVTYIGYLIAQHLLSNVPDDATGSLSAFQRNAADLRDHLLALAGVALRDRHTQIKSNVVVLSYNPTSRVVVVNGPVYKDWLEKGGSPDIVLGALLSDASTYGGDELLARSDVYLRQWTGYCGFHNAAHDVRRAQFLRSIYMIALTESMSDIKPYEVDYRAQFSNHAELVLANAQKLVDSSNLECLLDVECMAKELIAGLRFSYTPAKLILDNIDQTLKSTPNIEPREAALVAACAYAAKYWVKNMTVSKI